MTKEEFEGLLETATRQLTDEARQEAFTSSPQFENRVRQVLHHLASEHYEITFDPHPQCFPDIAMGDFGVEVKFTAKDTWRSVANSILESTRNADVNHIYIIFGKMGGVPEVKWEKYDDCVIHVRTSHVPRFEVEIGSHRSLFRDLGITYEEFSSLPIERKMHFIRQYARGRLPEGEHLWWLEETPEQEHSLPIGVRLYTSLSDEEKTRLRAEGTLLCPEVVKPSRAKGKYDNVAFYLLTYYGVMCSQARDLFSAGSVAHRADKTRGGNYVHRAIQCIEAEILDAAQRLEDALFQEYWGEVVPPEHRIQEWVRRADVLARDWTPSRDLFGGRFAY